LSLSLLWYPSYDEFDLQLVTTEADIILASCEQNKSNTDFDGATNLIKESETPYLFELAGDNYAFECSDGMKLLLWDDYLSTTAGLYIVGKNNDNQKNLPDSIAPYASLLGGRVYKWHFDG